MTATTDTTTLFHRYKQMRQHAPLYYSTKMNTWLCFTYEHCQSVLSNQRLFSARNELNTQGEPIATGLMMQDQPRHRELRNLLQPWFTPQAIANLTPRVIAIAQQLLDTVLAKREMALLQDFAHPFPLLVAMEHLGFPLADFAQIWNLLQQRDFHSSPATIAYFSQLLEQRRREPQHDLLTTLLCAHIEGQPLTLQEIVDVAGQVLRASDTTAHLIGNCFYLFAQYPQIAEEVRSDFTLIPGLLEEVLRCYPPFPRTRRRATCDTELGGQPIRQHQFIDCLIDSANRDEARFTEPDRFDLRRTPNAHLSFGYGKHFCLGAALARVEGRFALEQILERIPRFSVQNVGPLERQFGGLQGVKHLSLTW